MDARISRAVCLSASVAQTDRESSFASNTSPLRDSVELGVLQAVIIQIAINPRRENAPDFLKTSES
jgi:hypothetical protein